MIRFERPSWCPNKSCAFIKTTQDKVCAGLTPSGGRLCIMPGENANDICALIDLGEADINQLSELLESIYGARISTAVAASRDDG